MHAIARHYDQLGMRLRAVATAMSLEDACVKASEVDYILSRLPPDDRAGAAVLEIGCGYGRLVRAFLQRGIRYTGIDVNRAYVEWCQGEYRGQARFLVSDFLLEGGPTGESFDIVAFPWLLLTHYPFVEQAQMLARAVDLLAKDRRAYIVFDHLSVEDVGEGAYSVLESAEGHVLVPEAQGGRSELLCYVMKLDLARRFADENGLTLLVSTLRVPKVTKQYVFLVANG